MKGRRLSWWSVLIDGLFWLQPLSCLLALNLEPLAPGDHYGRVDPHGFGALGALMLAGLVFLPVSWLLKGRLPPAAASTRPPIRQIVAVLAVIGAPSLMQISYLRLGAVSWVWPVAAAAAAWFGLIAFLSMHRREHIPSPHGRFAERPYVAWTIVGGIAALNATLVILSLG